MSSISTTLDTTGLLCPLPVLKLRKQLKLLESGSIIKILANDPVAIIDIPNFCRENGHDLISSQQSNSLQIYLIQKDGRR
ncbi:MAG: sulfurtransferase TusA family protein [Aestuariivita sp.]|nr:sulfurtransferase TusA family protein [Aestuariivita sp.]